MAQGQNTLLYGNLVVQLGMQLASAIQTLQTAHSTGVDITDDQLAQASASAGVAIDQLQSDIDKMPG